MKNSTDIIITDSKASLEKVIQKIGFLIVLGVAVVMYEGVANGGFNRPW